MDLEHAASWKAARAKALQSSACAAVEGESGARVKASSGE
jgi:hypothetical protein